MLPPTLATVPVHIAIVGGDGTPAKGSVVFRIPVALRDTTSDVVVGPTALTATLDAAGEATISLPVTDDPDVTPQGWTYRVEVNTTVWSDRFNIAVPSGAGKLELADLAPAVTPPAVVTYLSVSQNLAELRDKAAARGNLGLGDAALADVGTTAGTVAAGDDSRIVGAETPAGAQDKADAAQAAAIAASAQRAANLSDLTSRPSARSNLGLGAARRSSLMPPVRAGVTMITAFQAGHGWTVTGAASSDLNDSTDFVLGSQAVKLVTPTSAVTATLDSPTATSYNLTGLMPRILIKVDGQANQATLRFFAGDTAFANFRNWNFGAPESNPAATFIKEGEWTWVTLNWTHASLTGTDPRAAVTRFRVSAASTAGTAMTVHVGAVTFVPEQTRWPNGVVSICFDDGRLSPFVNAKPKLDALGWAATAYPIVDRIGLASYATVAQLQQAYRYSGWEMGVHASTSARHDAGLNALTPEVLEDEIAFCQDWLAANNLGNGEGIAWPLGLSTRTHEEAAAKLCGYGRGNVSTTRETWPPPLPMRIRSVAVSNSNSLALIQGYVDEAKTNKAWLCLTFHEITTPGTNTLEWPAANFASLMDYIKAQGCAVLPVGDVLRNAGTTTA